MDELILASQCIDAIYMPLLSKLKKDAEDGGDELRRAYMAGAWALANHISTLLLSHRVMLQDDIPSLEELFIGGYETYISSKDKELTVESLIEAAKELGVYKD